MLRGTSFFLVCEVAAKPAYSNITWLRDDTVISVGDRRLQISGLQTDGNFTCIATNSRGSGTITTRVTVHCEFLLILILKPLNREKILILMMLKSVLLGNISNRVSFTLSAHQDLP